MTEQTKDAEFEIGVQKTVTMNPEEAWKFLTSYDGVQLWLGDVRLEFAPGETYQTLTGTTGQIRTVDEGVKIRLTWQPADWPSPTTVQLVLLPMGSRTSVYFHHEKLANSHEREMMRVHWQDVLEAIEQAADKNNTNKIPRP